jgi:hypothetical protein
VQLTHLVPETGHKPDNNITGRMFVQPLFVRYVDKQMLDNLLSTLFEENYMIEVS